MACPRCGAPASDSMRFCSSCGTSLGVSREERRLVSVLFADVVSSTQLASSIDPEVLRALIGRFYDRARTAVLAYGGVVDKLIGDAITAAFGIPMAHGDDARRAVLAAFAIREAVAADAELHERVRVRSAISTGEVVTALGSRHDLATGPVLHLAARLQQLAPPAGIVLDEPTFRMTELDIEHEGPFEADLKGFEGAVRYWRALAVRARGKQALAQLEGRGAELELFRAAEKRALDERRDQDIVVVGPAGIGKTTLLDRCLADLDGSWRVARGACIPYGTSLAYAPLASLLASLGGAGSIEELVRREVRRPGRADVLLASAGLAGGELPGAEELALAWRDFLATMALRRPLAVLLEDLHWASEDVLRLIEAVVRMPLDAPLLLLFSARDDALDGLRGRPRTRPDALRLELGPLSGVETRTAIARAAAGRLSGDTLTEIARRSEGNPFFALEMIRVAGSSPSVTIPETVQAAVLAQLDALPADARRAAQCAAVAGGSFSLADLRVVDPDLSPDQAEDALRRLRERDVAREAGPGRWSFRHALVRDVALATLPRRERAAGHERLGTWLADRSDDPDAIDLAPAHLVEACELHTSLGLALAAELRSATIAALRRSAARARRLFAISLARSQLERALKLVHDDGTRIAVLEELGDALFPSDEARTRHREALELGEGVGAEPIVRARLNRKLAEVAAYPGAHHPTPTVSELREHVERALVLAAEDPAERARALYALAAGPTLLREGTREHLAAARDALRILDEAASLIPDIANDPMGSMIAARRSTLLWHTGEYGRYQEAVQAQSSRLSERAGLNEHVELAIAEGYASLFLGRLEGFHTAARRALALAYEGELGHHRYHALQLAAYAAILRDEWDEAVALGERFAEEWARQGDRAAVCNRGGHAAVAEIHRRRGAPERAEPFDGDLDLGPDPIGPGGWSWVVRRLRLGDRPAQLASALVRLETARHDALLLGQVAEAAAELGDRDRWRQFVADPPQELPSFVVAQLSRSAGLIALGEEDPARARDELERALAILQDLGLRYEAAVTAVLLARAHPGRGEELREQAAAVFRSLGDRVSLAGLEEANPE